MLKTMLMTLTLALVLPPTVTAAATNSPAPAWLIEAIARQESSLNPLAVNVAGKDYYPATRQEAEAIIEAARSAGKNYDVGLMQINRWWIERHGIPPASLLDPDVNRQWGVWILEQEIARHGFNWRAVGKYHSPDEERGRQYAWRVHAAAQKNKPVGTAPITSVMIRTSHAHQEKSRDNLSDGGGVQRRTGQRQPGRIVTFPLPGPDQSGAAGQKP